MDLCALYTMLTAQMDGMLTGVLAAAAALAKKIAGNIPAPWGPRFGQRYGAAGTIAQKRRVVQRELARVNNIAAGAGAAALPWVAQAIKDLKDLDAILAAAEALEATRDSFAALKAKFC